jgi:heme exporter protein C
LKNSIIITVLKIVLLIWLAMVIIGAFLWAPLAEGLKEYTIVLYFHVPVAWLTVIAFFMSALYSIVYLRKRLPIYDAYAEASNQFGIMFALLATVTGSIWAKASWGAFWNWDPRESSIFVLLLIYAAYFALRSAIEEDEKKAALAAVYSILAFAAVPFFIFIIPRVYDSLHPDPVINEEGEIKMGGAILTVFISSIAGFSALFYWLFRLKSELIKSEFELNELEK